MAQLLDYHRREAQAGLVGVLRPRRDADPRSSIDDSEAIGGLDARSGRRRRCRRSGRSSTRSSFPAQEHKLVGARGTCATSTATATGESLDARSTSTGGLRAQARALVSRTAAADGADSRRARSTPTRSGRRCGGSRRASSRTASRADGPYRAVRDLLRALPPRVVGVEPGDAAAGRRRRPRARREVVARARRQLPLHPGAARLGQDLDRRAADRRLMRAGKRVGVTANSHKAIHNLLEEVEKVARERGRRVPRAEEVRRRRGRQRVRVELDVHRPVGDEDDARRRPDGRAAGRRHRLAVLAARIRPGARLPVHRRGGPGRRSPTRSRSARRRATSSCSATRCSSPQVSQGVHPDGAARRCSSTCSATHDTIPPERGLFLEQTRRMHPDVCRLHLRAGLRRAGSTRRRSCEPQRIDSPRADRHRAALAAGRARGQPRSTRPRRPRRSRDAIETLARRARSPTARATTRPLDARATSSSSRPTTRRCAACGARCRTACASAPSTSSRARRRRSCSSRWRRRAATRPPRNLSSSSSAATASTSRSRARWPGGPRGVAAPAARALQEAGGDEAGQRGGALRRAILVSTLWRKV